jgi:hypothetical protein
MPRTRPQLGQLGNRYAVVAAGSACHEWQPVDPNKPSLGIQQICCGSANIDVFDLQGASSTNPPQAFLGLLPQQDGGSCSFQQASSKLTTDNEFHLILVQGGSNCGMCDMASASVDGWFLMAGGQFSLNASDPVMVRFCRMYCCCQAAFGNNFLRSALHTRPTFFLLNNTNPPAFFITLSDANSAGCRLCVAVIQSA